LYSKVHFANILQVQENWFTDSIWVFCQLPAEKVPISVNHVIVVIMFGRLNRMEDKLGVRLGKSMGRYVVYFLLQLLYCFICSCFDE